MTGYSTESHKDLKVFSGRAHPELAEAVANELGIELVPTTARDFANGEIFIASRSQCAAPTALSCSPTRSR